MGPWRKHHLGVWLSIASITGAFSSTAFGNTPQPNSAAEERSKVSPEAPPEPRKSAAVPPLPAEYVTDDGGWLRVEYHPSAREKLRSVIPRMSEMRTELRAALGTEVLEELEIRVAALDAEMARLTPGEVTPTPRGAIFYEHHLIVLSAATRPGTSAQDLETGVRYQMARLALSEAIARRAVSQHRNEPSSGNAGSGGASGTADRRTHGTIPAWFEEAFATHFARERESSRAEALFLAAASGSLPHVSGLGLGLGQVDDESAFAADFVRFVSETNEGAVLPLVVEKVSEGSELDDAIAAALSSDRSGVDRAWRSDMAKRYALFPVLALSLVLWIALWMVGLVRRRRTLAASESTVARLKAHRRSRATEADGIITITTRPAKRDSTTSPRRSVESPRQHDGVYADQPGAAASGDGPSRQGGEASPHRAVEVEKIEHDGDWHTLH